MKKSPVYSLPRILIFMSIFSLFVYVANWVVYEALALLLGLSTTTELWWLGGILAVFSISFLVASILGMRFYNVFTRSLYYVTAVWMGFFVYLFFAAVLFGVVIMVGLPAATLWGLGFFGLAILTGVYGVLHARTIIVSAVEVRLEHLPTEWRGRKAVWVSDLHLGQIYGPDYARKIVRKVNALAHDIIFIGGDLYDGTGAPDIVELAAPLKEFTAPLGTYFITGNHEEIGDSRAFVQAVQAAGIVTLIDEKVEIEGLQIIGVDYRNASRAENLAAILGGLQIDLGKPSILLKHEPKDLGVARDAGISLQISGHTHRAQLWPLGYLAALIYKGYSYGLRTLGTMQVYTSSGVGTWGPPLRVGTSCEVVHITFV